MSLRPLELAQNLLNQAQQAQQKLAESAVDRAHAHSAAEDEQAEALRALHEVAKEREAQGHKVGDEDGAPREHPHGSGPGDASHEAHDPAHEHVVHADETPEGKGRALDIDV